MQAFKDNSGSQPTPEERRALFQVFEGRYPAGEGFRDEIEEWINSRVDPALRRPADLIVRAMVHAVVRPLYRIGTLLGDSQGLAHMRAIQESSGSVSAEGLLNLCYAPDEANALRRWVMHRTAIIVRRDLKASQKILYDPTPYINETAFLVAAMLLACQDIRRLPPAGFELRFEP